MKLFKIKLFYLIILLSFYVNAQVTVGSLIKPVKGSILDIKVQDADANNITAKGGLMLPRVELKDINELIFGDFSIADDDDG